MDAGSNISRAEAVAHPKSRSLTTNRPLHKRLNGNTAAGRRVRDLYRAFIGSMGNPTDTLSQANALHAAELAVAVEQQRLAAARGEPVDLNALVRLSNLADRAVGRLHLDRKREQPVPPHSKKRSLTVTLRDSVTP
jgi:hypothetical protein